MNKNGAYLKIKGSFLWILFLFVLNVPCLSQPKADSIKMIWSNPKLTAKERFDAFHDYYYFLIESNPKAVFQSSVAHFDLAKKENARKEMLRALTGQSSAYNMLGQYKKSLEISEIQYNYAKQFGDSNAIAGNQANRGVYYSNTGNYKEAVRCYMNSLAFYNEKKMHAKKVFPLISLGNVFNMIDDTKQALHYYEKALEILQKLGEQDQDEQIWISLAEVTLKMGDVEKSLAYTQKAFAILKNNNNKLGLATCNSLLARINAIKGNNDKAIDYAKRSLVIGLEIGIEPTITFKLELGKLLLNDKVIEATQIGEDVKLLINDSSSNQDMVNLYDLLYKCYKKQNKTDLSLKMLEKYNVYNERLIKQKKDFDIVRQVIQSEFANELRDTKIENTASIQKLKQKQSNNVVIILGISISIFLGSIFFYRKRLIANRKERDLLLNEIEFIKTTKNEPTLPVAPNGSKLDRDKIEKVLDRKINETDWTVLNILFDDPVISNKDIAEKAFLSVDGIASSLRRMYDLFEIKESKYKKISLLLETVKISNSNI